MNILVLNNGSSSLKFQLFETEPDEIEGGIGNCLAKGLVERIGSQAILTLEVIGQAKIKQTKVLRDHQAAINFVMQWIIAPETKIKGINNYQDIHAVGHRVVHGGESLTSSQKITAEVKDKIEDCIELAPLHNPANIKGIESISNLLGDKVTQVAVFDTAFHSTLPEEAYLYGIPYQLYRRYKIRKYGFHGNSHRYIGLQYRVINNLPREKVNIISLHLGNGCSACLIQNGVSVDTSMGLTPLDGLIMGTRSGDLDPSILEYLHLKEGLSFNEIDNLLNKRSGLLGISGLTSDMRELLAEEADNGDRRSKLAIDMFCKRIRKYIATYFVESAGNIDAIVFTGGIGENSAEIRERICNELSCIGLTLDKTSNLNCSNKNTLISSSDSLLKAYVIPTNEEIMIARDTVSVLNQK